jgi:hypothetical protein
MERRLRRTFRVRASCTWWDRTPPNAQRTQQIRSAKVVGLRARNLVRASVQGRVGGNYPQSATATLRQMNCRIDSLGATPFPPGVLNRQFDFG